MDLKEVYIWNVKYNLLNEKEIAEVVDTWLEEGKKDIHITGVDVNVISIAQKNDLLRKAILESDIVNVDSYLPAKCLALKGYDIKDRVTSPDVWEELLKVANHKKKKIYLFGATDATLEKLVAVIKEQYPDISIVGTRNGYFTEEEAPQIAKTISDLAPDFLFIGMPSPRKESFIMAFKGKINVGVYYGVGGAFDAKSGVLKRPPMLIRGHGGEALFRILRNPKHYGPRIRFYYDFFKLVIKNK